MTNIATAHTIANPKRTKYRRWRTDGFPVELGAAAVVMAILSLQV
jgi:hypothetical protein